VPDKPAVPVSAETFAAQAGGAVDPETGAVVLPIHVSSTYIRDPDNQYRKGFVYGRPDNATVRQAEAVIDRLEGGAGTLVFGSGMAAATAVFMALERPAHVVAPHVMYWALRNWLANDAVALGIETTFVDGGDAGAVSAAIRPGKTKLVWLETPANPLWTISDIGAVATATRGAGAQLAVDSTSATPVLTRPLSLGADIVMHAATKYLNGHSDVLAGSLSFARRDALFERAARVRNTLGAILGPFEAALLIRGLRTLHLRVRHQSASALAVAGHFRNHPKVLGVLYPGLQEHPGHPIAARQMQGGFGGMLSVRLKGGERAAIAAASAVTVWKRATSLGGVESLIEHRASIEGPTSPCPADLLRLSVGVEDVGDLIGDLERAIESDG
jgi:cystathionine gamma-synthase